MRLNTLATLAALCLAGSAAAQPITLQCVGGTKSLRNSAGKVMVEVDLTARAVLVALEHAPGVIWRYENGAFGRIAVKVAAWLPVLDEVEQFVQVTPSAVIWGARTEGEIQAVSWINRRALRGGKCRYYHFIGARIV